MRTSSPRGVTAVQRQTAAEAGRLLMTQGAPAIDALLRNPAARQAQPILGHTATTTLPALAPRAVGSIWDALQQD